MFPPTCTSAASPDEALDTPLAAALIDLPPSETVGRLLAQSRTHANLRTQLANTKPPQWAEATIAAANALAFRHQAHDLDPEHLDPEWVTDQQANKGATHQQMVDFLQKYVVAP